MRAYRRAATLLRRLPTSVAEIARTGGLAGLEALPGIGPSLARSIQRLVATGRLPMLERLRGESDPERLLASVPGVGRRTAERLHELGIESLEELEAAAHDGRLATLAGIGPKRLAGIRDSLAGRLGRIRSGAAGAASGGPARARPGATAPSVRELLDVDREYRERARAGALARIAPRRFNPGREAWLPVLHTQRGSHHYTALFSNTARAHRLGKTDDWVVIYGDGDAAERQYTVITATRGALRGRRIVLGREEECHVLAPRDTRGP